MEIRIMNFSMITAFKNDLIDMEKSEATVKKYVRDVIAFYRYSVDRDNTEKADESDTERKAVITKEKALAYKAELKKKGYMPASINSMLISINRFFKFAGWEDLRVKRIKMQRKVFQDEEKLLTEEDYERLIKAAGENSEKGLIIQTICSTGIRVSELKYFTVKAVEDGKAEVDCKGKIRTVLIPEKMRKKLKRFVKKRNIKEGVIFRTQKGNPLDRSRIWSMMKSLCEKAEVKKSKVFPHNLRKLFARCFYEVDKDIARLADILGHLNINTTRIYIMNTLKEQIKVINSLGLVYEGENGEIAGNRKIT